MEGWPLAHVGEIRTGAFRSPLKRVVVHALGRERVMAVALDFIPQGPDHLRMAEIAAFADIDVATGQFQRRVRPDAIDHFDGALQIEQRRNLDEAANGNDRENTSDQDDRGFLKDLVSAPERNLVAPPSAG